MGVVTVLFAIYLIVWLVQSCRIMDGKCASNIAYTYMTYGLLLSTLLLTIGFVFLPSVN